MSSLPFGDCMVFRGGFGGGGGGFVGPSSNLVLEPERGELGRSMKAAKSGDAVGPEMKAAMAMKSHCEAERRRRERINSHLSTLRGLVPTTSKVSKMDKATLLAQVIKQVKELKNNASQISQKIKLPSDTDEVVVEAFIDEMNPRTMLIKASICCKDRPELLSDLKKTIRSLHLKIMSSDIAFLEGRVKNEFVVACEGNTNGPNMEKYKNKLRTSLQMALESVLDRISAQVEFSPTTLLAGGKRRRSPFESSPYSLS